MKHFIGIGILTCMGILLSFTSCSYSHDEVKDSHSHGQQITAYNDEYELFAEVIPFVVGERSVVVAHITRLVDFKTLDSARVVMVLGVNGEEQRFENGAILNSGIYQFEVIPKEAGVGMMRVEIEQEGCVGSIDFSPITVYASSKEMHSVMHSDEAEVEDGVNAIVFTKEQSWKVDFGTEVVESRPFGRVIKTVAQVLPSQGDERGVSARTSGIVVFNNPNLVEGASVNTAQKLFSIESSGMADNNMGVKFSEAIATYDMAKEEYERRLKLEADKIVTKSELQRSKMELDMAKAVYDNLKNNFSSSGEFVSSPISGFVKNILVKNGSYVDAGQLIMTVSKNRDLFVRADVSPRYYQDLAHIKGATIQLMNSEEVYDLAELEGDIVSYGRSVDLENPLVPVTFKFRNTVDLLSGGFVTLYIRVEADDEVITVPNGGIVEEMGAYFVFVQINPELFEKREVRIGATDGILTEIKSGISVGERVVVRGAMMVKLAQSSAMLDPHAGHVH